MDKFMHICEVCGKEEMLTSKEAFEAGWDYPPDFGKFGVLSPRTCPNCEMQDTAWFAFMFGKPITEKHRQTIERIKNEV